MATSKITVRFIRYKTHTVLRNRFPAVFVLVFILAATLWFMHGKTQAVTAVSKYSAAMSNSKRQTTAYQSNQLPFIENVGQFDEQIYFQARSGNAELYLTDNALWISLTEPPPKSDPTATTEKYGAVDSAGETRRQVNLKLSFVDANPRPTLEAFAKLDTQVSFLTGNDPANWHVDAPVWGGVRYVELYPGIDLEITSQNGQLIQQLIVREPSSLQDVRLQVEGTDNLTLEDNHLRLATPLGNIALPLLSVAGGMPEVKPAIAMVGEVYHVHSPFASIVPTSRTTLESATALIFSTYLGGRGDDRGTDLVLDNEGNAYIIGQTSSTDFPTTPGAYGRLYDGDPWDVFISKLSADGNTLLYSTYLGGSGADVGLGIKVDGDGNTYITGYTFSTNFPTTDGALDRSLDGGRDAFVAKLNAAGNNLIYSTYLGGGSWDYGYCIEVDQIGNVYVGGFTHGNFPVTSGAAQTAFGGSGDGFAVKVNPNGNTILYSTYLGGYSWESIDGIAVDNAGNAYLASHTHSTDFPTTPGAWDRTCDNCQTNVSTDGAVAKLNADGSEYIYSTLIGGADATGGEVFTGVVIDSAGNAYLTGNTHSIDFPTTTNALQPAFGGGDDDAVVVKLNADGSDLLYSTYLGGSGADVGYGIAIDDEGNAYVTGSTNSTDLVTVDPLQADNAGGCDAFVAKVNGNGNDLLYGTYLGGSGDENCHNPPHDYGAIALAGTSNIYLAGFTDSSDFPVTDAYDVSFTGGTFDTFVTSLDIAFIREELLFLPLLLR
jgi:hypothetical protein